MPAATAQQQSPPQPATTTTMCCCAFCYCSAAWHCSFSALLGSQNIFYLANKQILKVEYFIINIPSFPPSHILLNKVGKYYKKNRIFFWSLISVMKKELFSQVRFYFGHLTIICPIIFFVWGSKLKADKFFGGVRNSKWFRLGQKSCVSNSPPRPSFMAKFYYHLHFFSFSRPLHKFLAKIV